MLCRIRVVQIQLKEHVIDHADRTAPTRNMSTVQIFPETSDRQAGIGDPSDV